jgi:tetratricopeptide (TPR) repeat protein
MPCNNGCWAGENIIKFHSIFLDFCPLPDRATGRWEKLSLRSAIAPSGFTLKVADTDDFEVGLALQFSGPTDLDTLSSAADLGTCLERLGKYDEAESALQGALAARRRVQGREHRDTLLLATDYAKVLQKLQRFREAMEIYREVCQAWKRIERGTPGLGLKMAASGLAHCGVAWGEWAGDEGREAMAAMAGMDFDPSMLP